MKASKNRKGARRLVSANPAVAELSTTGAHELPLGAVGAKPAGAGVSSADSSSSSRPRRTAGPAPDPVVPGPAARHAASPGVRRLIDELVQADPEAADLLDQATLDMDVSVALNQLRTDAGLTMRALAGRVGTTASVIARLEDASYTGHSLTMLRRIAAALGKRVAIGFVDVGQGQAESVHSAPAGKGRGRREGRRT